MQAKVTMHADMSVLMGICPIKSSRKVLMQAYVTMYADISVYMGYVCYACYVCDVCYVCYVYT